MNVSTENAETLFETHLMVDAVFVPRCTCDVDVDCSCQSHREQGAKPKVFVIADESHLVDADFGGSVAPYSGGSGSFGENL